MFDDYAIFSKKDELAEISSMRIGFSSASYVVSIQGHYRSANYKEKDMGKGYLIQGSNA